MLGHDKYDRAGQHPYSLFSSSEISKDTAIFGVYTRFWPNPSDR